MNRSITLSLLLLFSIVIFFNACDLDAVLTDQSTGEDISILLIDPNFTTTDFQLRLLDLETGNRIEQPVDVELFSNKPLIDLSGKFINNATVTNGLLNFSLSPNEKISLTDTLFILINATSEDFVYNFSPKIEQATNEKYSVLIMEGKKFNETNLNQTNNLTPLSTIVNGNIGSFGVNSSDVSIRVSGVPWKEFTKPENYLLRPNIFGDPAGARSTIYNRDRVFKEIYWNSIAFERFWDVLFGRGNIRTAFGEKLQADVEFSIYYANTLTANRLAHNFVILYKDGPSVVLARIFPGGKTSVYRNLYDGLSLERFTRASYNDKFILEKGSQIRYLEVEHIVDQPYLDQCNDGFNFEFEGLQNDTPVEFQYGVTRDNTYLAAIGVTSLTNKYSVHNTGSHYYSTDQNRVEFKENSQYLIQPGILELGGANACGSTYTFQVFPKGDVDNYKVSVQLQCQGQNQSVNPTVTVFFKEKGQTGWEGTRFTSGRSSLYLKENSLYEIDGTYEGSDFSFMFGTGEEQLAQAISETVQNNPDIHNILFNKNILNGEKQIDIKMIFTSESCPI